MAIDATIHVVDDDAGALRSTRWLLESVGHAVQTHASAADFLAAYRPDSPGCLLLDMRMPGIDGLGLQQRMATRGLRLPVVFLTAYGTVAQCAQAMKNGAVHFLEKPADDQQILNAVREALDEDRRRRHFEASRPEIAARVNRLTPRERRVMQLLYEGRSIKNIATMLGVSFQTVAKHRSRVFEKLRIENETQLVRLLGEWPFKDPEAAT